MSESQPEPAWWPVLTATLATVWQRRGDAWAQVAALTVTVTPT